MCKTFIAPAARLPEFFPVETSVQSALPKIPMHILMFILNFFEKLSRQYRVEALVHILYDTMHGKYTIRVPKQELTRTSVHSVLEEEYPEHLIHVMDIHSHNTMPAKFSPIDGEDEKATRLYAVVGKLDQVFPDITVRASCTGKFIPLCPEDVFETNFKAYSYPQIWDRQIVMNKKWLFRKLLLNFPFNGRRSGRMKYSKTAPIKIVILGAGETGGYVIPHLYRLSFASNRNVRSSYATATL